MAVATIDIASETMDISDARRQINSMSERLKDKRVVVVTRYNRGAFAMVDLETLASFVKIMETLASPTAMQSLRNSVGNIPASV